MNNARGGTARASPRPTSFLFLSVGVGVSTTRGVTPHPPLTRSPFSHRRRLSLCILHSSLFIRSASPSCHIERKRNIFAACRNLRISLIKSQDGALPSRAKIFHSVQDDRVEGTKVFVIVGTGVLDCPLRKPSVRPVAQAKRPTRCVANEK